MFDIFRSPLENKLCTLVGVPVCLEITAMPFSPLLSFYFLNYVWLAIGESHVLEKTVETVCRM